MKTTTEYLNELEDKLLDKLIMGNQWEEDSRFSSKKEAQMYNKGIHEGISLVEELLQSDEFKSPIVLSLERSIIS